MKLSSRSAVIALSVTLGLSGCIWSPGQHMARSGGSDTGIRTVGNDQLDLIPITPKLIAMERASRVDAHALPPALADWRPSDYTIGPGDVLYITVWDHPELTVPAGAQQQLNAAGRHVQADGNLFYPYIGTVKAAGQTPEQLRQAITTRLARYIESPQVDVSILTYASQRVWVTGAAANAATVPLTTVPLTLNDAISQSGINPTQADLSGLRLTRDGVTYTLDLDQQARDAIYLRDGDHLYIPFLDAKEVFVVGEVMQPGALDFRTGSISLSQAIGRARGLAQISASGNAVYVIRGSRDLETAPSVVYQLEAKSPAAFAVASQFELLPGDVVFVGAAGITRWNRFVTQLLPFSSIIRNAAGTSNDI
ncbi:polysaccharide biosynthesis/export family protein [Luteimonas sp. BDR2-5]|uniref:polysaccharide biosynthesis/export family protein n=1 Tax=Proluteimonas luteida TaxID=2878685 RepID=UPI001E5CE4F1|nr:polysaccharide biosynthesis/export family protein [Luteimonas sp. BDR2-5]MCD9028704.1 polysaccharide biosynthesis/export family protein [Luteimonas sp. BDR2-5]